MLATADCCGIPAFMKSGLHFLVAAKRCEIGELEHLALTGTLVKVVGRLIHELQRERGISNVFLASLATRFAEQLGHQCATCRRIEKQARAAFEQWDVADSRGGPGNGARLFNRIAYVLHGLDGLPALRQRIGAQNITPAETTTSFIKLIAGLLSVVFEAADSATDPEISRHLVAMFHFMQGKEFAGQERALGSMMFASGHTDAADQQQWLHLIESQERCFKVFMEFSPAAVHELWHNCMPTGLRLTLDHLRHAGHAAATTLDPNQSQEWYQVTTRRIDAMKTVEEKLAANLINSCKDKISESRAELEQQQKLLGALEQGSPDTEKHVASSFFDASELHAPAPPAGSPPILYGPQLERSILDMVQQQSLRLQAMGDELQTVRAALNERKLVERAKGLLMAHRRINEDEAYKLLRQTAMNQNRRLAEVAEAVLATVDLLPDRATSGRSGHSG
jgi:Nitrate and nitrite sensing/ANTAR domain